MCVSDFTRQSVHSCRFRLLQRILYFDGCTQSFGIRVQLLGWGSGRYCDESLHQLLRAICVTQSFAEQVLPLQADPERQRLWTSAHQSVMKSWEAATSNSLTHADMHAPSTHQAAVALCFKLALDF